MRRERGEMLFGEVGVVRGMRNRKVGGEERRNDGRGTSAEGKVDK